MILAIIPPSVDSGYEFRRYVRGGTHRLAWIGDNIAVKQSLSPGEEFVALMSILSLDLDETFERIQTDPFHQPARRTWVRTFCSQLEAFVYCTKQMVAGLADLPIVTLSGKDLAYIREEPEPGKTILRRMPLRDNVKHMVAVTSGAMGFTYQLDTGPGWTAMLQTISIRDRLVHPKTAQSLLVTDDELRTITSAQVWFHQLSRELWSHISNSLLATPKA